jgi:chromosome segregation ATPase
LIVCIFFKL